MDEPTISSERQAPEPALAARAPRAAGRTWFKRIVLACVGLALVPLILTILYLLPFVHPVSTLMLGDFVTLQGYDRQWVSIDDVAPALVNSVVMSEDGQFCSHQGIDWNQMRGVIDDTLAGEQTRGASTITMQTAKNLFLWNGRSFLRKALELPLALYIDLLMTKRRILEIYLNIAEWGPGAYGIQAGAQHRFGVSAKALTARQAALMAVSLPNPIDRNPAKPSPGLRRLASLIQRRAAMAGDYTQCLH